MMGYLNYVGLVRKKRQNAEKVSYVPSKKIEVAKAYLAYLKELDHYQKERRNTIESKNSQLVGQASVVSTIFSLFITLVLNNSDGLSGGLLFTIIFLFVFVLFHYLFAVIHAIRTLKINRFPYATRTTTTVAKKKRATTELAFLNQEIDDLVFSIEWAKPIDNDKANNLIYSTRCFEIANIGFAILAVVFIGTWFLLRGESSSEKTTFDNPKKVEVVVEK